MLPQDALKRLPTKRLIVHFDSPSLITIVDQFQLLYRISVNMTRWRRTGVLEVELTPAVIEHIADIE
jgi:hypothetical protein